MTTVESLASLVEGTVVGDGSWAIDAVAPLAAAGPRDVSFFANPKYRGELLRTEAGAILIARDVADDIDGDLGPSRNLILCGDPYLAMATVARHLHPGIGAAAGVEPGALVHPEAQVDASACVRAGAVIDAGARVGARSSIGPTAYVGRHAELGDDVLLHAGAKVLDRCVVGDRVILQAGAVIGSDGFGYAPDAEKRRHKIPQVGIVVLEADVEVGANSTIDRATFGETRIGRGTKIDNLVQVAHNVVTGEDCVIVSQSGIAGSTRLGRRVIMGAQTGMVGHIEIADDVTLGARGAFGQDVAVSGVYSGAPAIPHRQWLKATLIGYQLPELRRRLQSLEKRLVEECKRSDRLRGES